MIESRDALRSNVERVVTNEISDPLLYTATRFVYDSNGTAVTFMLGESWEEDDSDPDLCPENYAITFAREFRYDSGRARYLNRELDPAGLMQVPPVSTVLDETWTDYDGDQPYGDYTVTVGSGDPLVAETGGYQPGMWRKTAGVAEYLHNDHLGTLRRTTSSTGVPGASRVFTAFGERAAGPDDRFGYVGAWGYQQHGEFPFLHVGARWYDPASGRFLQRDPLGIGGGRNVYSYAGNDPTSRIDASGTSSIQVGLMTGAISVFEFLELLGYSALTTAAVVHHIWHPMVRVNSPARGEPNSTSVIDCGGGNVTIRDYDANGRAYRDYDYGHSHGAGDPHVHDWDWSGPKPERGPHRPWGPDDGYLPGSGGGPR